jgi:type VI secretion system secreted protein Hcp
MAADTYLFIEGIKGESNDARHKDWMECKHVDWGVHQPASAVDAACGRAVGRCHHDTIVLLKDVDLASPILLQTCCMGKTLPKARIEFMRANGSVPFTYFVIELENVLIGEVAPEVSEGQIMQEFVSLAFSSIKWNYARQSIAGAALGHTMGGWNLATNTRLA